MCNKDGGFNKFSVLFFRIFWCFIFFVGSGNIFALQSDKQKNTEVEAAYATFDYKNKITIFSGDVIITKGSLVIHADKGSAQDKGLVQDKEDYKLFNLSGTPVTFEQLEDDGDKIEGQGNNFEYNTKTNLAILIGRARVKKGKNIVIGDKITYNVVTQVYSVSGMVSNFNKKPQGRVTVILDKGSVPSEFDNVKK